MLHHSREGTSPATKTLNPSIRNDIIQSETTTNRKVRSHLVRKKTYKLSLYIFYCFWSFLDFLLFFVLFCFQINLFLAFSWLYTIFVWSYAFSLIVFWSRDLWTSGLMTSHLTLRPPEFLVLTRLKN